MVQNKIMVREAQKQRFVVPNFHPVHHWKVREMGKRKGRRGGGFFFGHATDASLRQGMGLARKSWRRGDLSIFTYKEGQ